MGLRRCSAAPFPFLTLGLYLSAFVFLSLLLTTTSEDVEVGIDAEDPLVAHKAGSSSKKSGLFERLSRVLDTGAAEDDDGVPFTDEQWHATKDLGEPVDPALMTFKMPSEMVDAWDKDKGLRILQQTMDGDLTGPMRGLVADVKDLHEAWAKPHLFRALMSQIPLFHAIKPIQAIVMGKNEEDYTAEDGIAAAGAFKGFMVRALDSMDVLRNPERLAEKMLTYASSKDKTLLDLFAKASRGEDENHKEINNFFLKKELGDLIDLDFLGFNGVEPTFLGGFRDKVKEFSPVMYDSIITDPNMKKYIENPFKALDEAKDILRTFQGR